MYIFWIFSPTRILLLGSAKKVEVYFLKAIESFFFFFEVRVCSRLLPPVGFGAFRKRAIKYNNVAEIVLFKKRLLRLSCLRNNLFVLPDEQKGKKKKKKYVQESEIDSSWPHGWLHTPSIHTSRSSTIEKHCFELIIMKDAGSLHIGYLDGENV